MAKPFSGHSPPLCTEQPEAEGDLGQGDPGQGPHSL